MGVMGCLILIVFDRVVCGFCGWCGWRWGVDTVKGGMWVSQLTYRCY